MNSMLLNKEDNTKKERFIYNNDLLNQMIEKYNINNVTYDTDKLFNKSIISFNCNCGNRHNKVFIQLVKTGAYCYNCCVKNGVEKKKDTNLKRHGTMYPMLKDEVQNKIKQQNIEKYGVEYPLMSEKFKQQFKEKMKEKYGVEHPSLSSDLIELKKQNNFKKYGYTSVAQIPEVKEKMKNTNIEKYGVPFTLMSEDVQNKSKETCLNKYGTLYAIQNEEIQDKRKKTMVEIYGVEVPAKSQQVLDKMKNTMLERHGVEYSFQSPLMLEKRVKTNIEKYGFECPLSNSDVQNKIKKQYLEKYGVEYPMQRKDIQKKSLLSCLKKKIYRMPDGKEYYVQGFEPYAINLLLKEYTHDEIMIDCNEMPCFPYFYDNKKKMYFPDIFLQKENKVIEVKSTWTIKLNTDKILEKQKAVEDANYECVIWIFDKGGKFIEEIKNSKELQEKLDNKTIISRSSIIK